MTSQSGHLQGIKWVESQTMSGIKRVESQRLSAISKKEGVPTNSMHNQTWVDT